MIKAKWDKLSPQVQHLAGQTYRVIESGDNQILSFEEIERALKQSGVKSNQASLANALEFLEECEFICSREQFYVLRPVFAAFPVTVHDHFDARLDMELGRVTTKQWVVQKMMQLIGVIMNDLIHDEELKDHRDVVFEVHEKLEDVNKIVFTVIDPDQDDDNLKKRSSREEEEEQQQVKKRRSLED